MRRRANSPCTFAVMNVSLTVEESAAVRKALRSYLSDLRAEIADTDNPEYRRELREERAALEGAVDKLDQAGESGSTAEGGDAPHAVRIVELWWTTEEH